MARRLATDKIARMTRRTFQASLLLWTSGRARAEDSLIGNGSGLDHIGIVGAHLLDLEQAFRERLGFSLYSGSRYPTGVYNALVPFQGTPAYLELLSFYKQVDRSDLATAYLEDRMRVGGPAFFAVNCAPIEGTAARLRDHGFTLIGPRGRTVLRNGKEEPAPYQIVRVNEDLIGPKESLSFIEYRNNAERLGPERLANVRKRLQQPSGEFHPNTARRLESVWVAVRDLNQATEVMRRMGFTSGAVRQAPLLFATGREFLCGGGMIVLWAPRGRGTMDGVLNQRGEGPFGMTLEVLDINAARRTLERGGTKLKPEWVTDHGFIIPPEISGGSWMEFKSRL